MKVEIHDNHNYLLPANTNQMGDGERELLDIAEWLGFERSPFGKGQYLRALEHERETIFQRARY